jgi:hypothetical protein
MKKCFTCENFNDGDFSHTCEQCTIDFNKIHKYTQYESNINKRFRLHEFKRQITTEDGSWIVDVKP